MSLGWIRKAPTLAQPLLGPISALPADFRGWWKLLLPGAIEGKWGPRKGRERVFLRLPLAMSIALLCQYAIFRRPGMEANAQNLGLIRRSLPPKNEAIALGRGHTSARKTPHQLG